VGYGSIGKRHVNNLAKFTNTQIIVCTKNKEATQLVKNGIKVFDSLTNALCEKPDIGIICNETSLHVKTAIRLAEHNCNLFIEKPLSSSLNGTQRLLSLIKKKKLISMVGCNMRFHKSINKIKKIIDSGDLGRIISVHAENGSFLPDWHPWENYQISYASNKKLGGGVVLTQIHEIDYLYWFFGKVAEVSSFTGKFSDLKINVEDLSAILLKFQKNIIAEVHLDYFQQPESRNCKVVGTRGVLYWDSDTNKVRYYDNLKKKWYTKFTYENYQRNDMFVDELKYFLNCIKNKKNTMNPIEEGLVTLGITLAIKKSSSTRKFVTVKNN